MLRHVDAIARKVCIDLRTPAPVDMPKSSACLTYSAITWCLARMATMRLPTLGLEVMTLVLGLEPGPGRLTVNFSRLTWPTKDLTALLSLPASTVS